MIFKKYFWAVVILGGRIRDAIIAFEELLFKMGFTTSNGPFPPIILLAPDNSPAAFILILE